MTELSNFSKHSFVTFTGDKPGKTVAIFAGVHGNETAGIEALSDFIQDPKIDCGTVYCALANPEAIKKNVREVDANINRCFSRSIPVTLEEHKRANELMDLLDSCDALLDLHSSNSKEAVSFIICDEQELELVKHFNFSIVSTGWSEVEPGGSDSYMHAKNKIGITAECGSIHNPEEGRKKADEAIQVFLRLLGVKKGSKKLPIYKQKRIDVTQCIRKESEEFRYAKDFKDFEELEEGSVFAKDGEKRYVAEKNQVIIFPRPNKPIGGEAGIIGKIVKD